MEKVEKSKISRISNPILASLNKINETSETKCTYAGIAKKTIYFLILTAIGVALYFIIHGSLTKTGELGGIALGTTENLILVIFLIITVVSAIFATIFKRATAFWGSIYAICEGSILAYITITYAGTYTGIVWQAIGLTILVIVTMLILYSTGTIRVNKKFRTAITTLLIVSIVSSLIYFLLILFMPNNPIQQLIESSGPLAIGLSAIGVLIAALFLVTDFENIKQSVVNELPKKYEWSAAFGLSFTILWLYLRVLTLVAEIKD